MRGYAPNHPRYSQVHHYKKWTQKQKDNERDEEKAKTSTYEGGLRVPLAVWWSGIAKPGSTCDTPVLSMDFYPTLLQLAGADRPSHHILDGESLVPLLQRTGNLKRDPPSNCGIAR